MVLGCIAITNIVKQWQPSYGAECHIWSALVELILNSLNGIVAAAASCLTRHILDIALILLWPDTRRTFFRSHFREFFAFCNGCCVSLIFGSNELVCYWQVWSHLKAHIIVIQSTEESDTLRYTETGILVLIEVKV